MTTSASTVQQWAAVTFPDHRWDGATSHHGAFHDVLVIDGGVVLRVVIGDDAVRRAHREVATLRTVEDIRLAVAVPRVLSDAVVAAGRVGYLITAAPGAPHPPSDWSDLSGAISRLLTSLAAAPTNLSLPPPRQWCGGDLLPHVVEQHLADSLGCHLPAALDLVRTLLEQPPPRRPVLVHGDFGAHNILWRQGGPAALIDWDHACVGDPAIDIAPLIGGHGSSAVSQVVAAEDLERSMIHRATLPLQVAAAAALAGQTALRDHAVQNFTQRLVAGTLHDPGGARPDRT